MKKDYIIPETLLMEIRLQQLITASEKRPERTLYEDEEADENGVVLTRRHKSVWDDAEEEMLEEEEYF